MKKDPVRAPYSVLFVALSSIHRYGAYILPCKIFETPMNRRHVLAITLIVNRTVSYRSDDYSWVWLLQISL